MQPPPVALQSTHPRPRLIHLMLPPELLQTHPPPRLLPPLRLRQIRRILQRLPSIFLQPLPPGKRRLPRSSLTIARNARASALLPSSHNPIPPASSTRLNCEAVNGIGRPFSSDQTINARNKSPPSATYPLAMPASRRPSHSVRRCQTHPHPATTPPAHTATGATDAAKSSPSSPGKSPYPHSTTPPGSPGEPLPPSSCLRGMHPRPPDLRPPLPTRLWTPASPLPALPSPARSPHPRHEHLRLGPRRNPPPPGEKPSARTATRSTLSPAARRIGPPSIPRRKPGTPIQTPLATQPISQLNVGRASARGGLQSAQPHH